MDKYKGKQVTVLRQATASDDGFDTNDHNNDQVMIELDDGSRKVVKKSEVQHS
jgi:hypothetical protein